MPTLTITFEQPVWDRILLTYPAGTTEADVEEKWKQELQSKVGQREADDAANTVHDNVKKEIW